MVEEDIKRVQDRSSQQGRKSRTLIIKQMWPLKAKGKLQMCGHLWLPGTYPGVFWL